MRKYAIIGILAVLFLLPMVHAQSIFEADNPRVRRHDSTAEIGIRLPWNLEHRLPELRKNPRWPRKVVYEPMPKPLYRYYYKAQQNPSKVHQEHYYKARKHPSKVHQRAYYKVSTPPLKVRRSFYYKE